MIRNVKNQWNILNNNFNKGTILKISIEVIKKIIIERLKIYSERVSSNITKHINNLQLYCTIKEFKKYDVLMKNVYTIKIEPEYYNTYSMLCNETRHAFKKCYDVLGKLVISKKNIENSIKKRIKGDNIQNINFIQGLELMRRQSLEVKRINKRYNKEKNSFTIKIRVILYEITKVLDLIMNINMMENNEYIIKKYNNELEFLEKILYEMKNSNNKSNKEMIMNSLWKIQLKEPLKKYDLKNQINNLKDVYLLKTNTLTKIKVFIINNLISIIKRDYRH